MDWGKTQEKYLITSILVNVGISKRVNRMRIGKLQKQILKVMYEYETSPAIDKDFEHYIENFGKLIKILTAREIVERVTGLKYPKEKDLNFNIREWRFNKIQRCIAYMKIHGKGKFPPDTKEDKIMEKVFEERELWHKASTSVYRAIKLLEKNILITDVRMGFESWTCRDFYKLTQKGRRIIAHRK